MAGRVCLPCLFLALWLCAGGLAPGWAGVRAELDPSETELGRPVLLRVLVAGEAQARIDVSGLGDFTVTPRGRVVGRRTAEGREQAVSVYRFELTPLRAGELVIPPLAVTLPEAVLRTGELRLRVRPKARPPAELAHQDIALAASVATDTPVVGEPFRYTLRLYRAKAVASAAVAPPDFPGFAVEVLPGQRDGEITVQGRTFAVTEVDYQLTALQPGRAVLDPGSAVCRTRGTPGRAGSSRELTCASAPVVVTVRPKPAVAAAPVPAPPATPPAPTADLPPDALRDDRPPSWPLVAVLALLGPGLYLASRLPARRSRPGQQSLPLSPSALAEELRRRLPLLPENIRPPLHQCLDRLDRLLYAGESPDPRTLDEAARAARTLLEELADQRRTTSWKYLPLLVLLLLPWAPGSPVRAGAEALDQDLAAVRAALAAGEPGRAVAALETAYRNGARNADLCLVAATAAAQAGDKAGTSRWLLRAHGLDPAAPKVRNALAALDRIVPGPRTILAGRLAPRHLVWLALAGNTAFWLFLALLRDGRWRIPRRYALLAGALAAWLWLEAGLAVFGPGWWPVGVVRHETMALCAPEPGAEPLFPLAAGQVVRRGPQRDDFVRITAGPDRPGWVPATDVPGAEP